MGIKIFFFSLDFWGFLGNFHHGDMNVGNLHSRYGKSVSADQGLPLPIQTRVRIALRSPDSSLPVHLPASLPAIQPTKLSGYDLSVIVGSHILEPLFAPFYYYLVCMLRHFQACSLSGLSLPDLHIGAP